MELLNVITIHDDVVVDITSFCVSAECIAPDTKDAIVAEAEALFINLIEKHAGHKLTDDYKQRYIENGYCQFKVGEPVGGICLTWSVAG